MRRKNSWATRSGALLVGAALLAGTSLTGCGKQTSSNEKETQTGAIADNLNETGLPILKEKETFTIAVKQQSPIKTADQKRCVIETENDTNIHIEWIEIPDSAWKEKINIMFSTDSMPDVILGPVDTTKYYEQLVPLDDYLDTYAPITAEYFKTRDEYPKMLTSPDGKIHGLPTGDEAAVNTIDSQLWINADWLSKVGKEMPTTPEELKEVLIAFRDQDPNGNGINDEIPFTFNKLTSWGDPIENFFGSWGVVENGSHVFVKDDTVIFSAREQGYYDALSYLNELYKEGLIDKEVFTLSIEQYASRGAAGDVIGLMAAYRESDCSVDNGAPGENRYQALPLLKGKDGTQMTGLNNVARGGGFHITKSCKNPEAMLRWYDYVNSSLEQVMKWNRGLKGINCDIEIVDGKEIPVNIFMTGDQLKENGGYKTAAEFRTAEYFAGQSPSLWKVEYDMVVKSTSSRPDLKKASVKEQMEFGVESLPDSSSTIPGNTERRSILLTDINNYLDKFTADSVINGINEEKWAAHLKTLSDLKVDEYTKLCQEFLDEYNER